MEEAAAQAGRRRATWWRAALLTLVGLGAVASMVLIWTGIGLLA